MTTRSLRAAVRLGDVLGQVVAVVTDTESDLVAQARIRIKSRLHEFLAVIDLARDVEGSREHLVRTLRRALGTTAVGCLRQRRFVRACHLLTTTRLPIDAIKLDRSFTLGLTGAPRERVVVETMVRLSKQLGLTVIAEGVEDDLQLEATRLAGCDGIQGYRVAAAMDGDTLLAFCDQWQQREGSE